MSMNQTNSYLADANTMYRDTPDYHFLQGVFFRIVSDYDPNRDLPMPELLAIFYGRLELLGIKVVD